MANNLQGYRHRFLSTRKFLEFILAILWSLWKVFPPESCRATVAFDRREGLGAHLAGRSPIAAKIRRQIGSTNICIAKKKRAAKRPTYSLFMSKFRPFSKIIAFDISFCVVSATQCSLLSSVYCRTNSAAYRALRSRSNVREFARSWLLTGCVENLNLRCSEKLKNFLRRQRFPWKAWCTKSFDWTHSKVSSFRTIWMKTRD